MNIEAENVTQAPEIEITSVTTPNDQQRLPDFQS